MPLLMTIITSVDIYFGMKPVYTDLTMQYNSLLNINGAIVDDSGVQVLREPSISNSSVEETEETGNRQIVNEPGIGICYGKIQCERIGLKCDLYFGDNNEQLNLGAGTYPGSWIPGCGGTTLIAGHNQTDFNSLQHVEVGDEFVITANYGTYTYRVSEYTIVKETDAEACRLDSEEEQVVLYTCYPFYKISGRRTERFFVYLEKISGPEIELQYYYFKEARDTVHVANSEDVEENESNE